MFDWIKKLFKSKPKKPYWTCVCGHEVYWLYDAHGSSYTLIKYYMTKHQIVCPRHIEASRPITNPNKILRRQVNRRR